MVEAKFEKSGSLEAMEAPLLDVYTQGKPKADALFMLADAPESLVNKVSFQVVVTETASGEAAIASSVNQARTAMVLRSAKHKRSVPG